MQCGQPTLSECEKQLEPDEYQDALAVVRLEDFQAKLETFSKDPDLDLSDASKQLIAVELLAPILAHYELFTRIFVKAMAHTSADTSIMRGLLRLVFERALPSAGDSPERPLDQIIKWLRKIGYELRASNNRAAQMPVAELVKLKEDTTERSQELVNLWINIIAALAWPKGAQTGGVGKTQIALAYGSEQVAAKVDAVLWIAAENALTLSQRFGHTALKTLQLPAASWLLTFDNVDNHADVVDYWPVSRQGSIPITTRDRAIAAQPVQQGLEIREFNNDVGAQFLLESCEKRGRKPNEDLMAKDVSEALGGLPLAINQMATFHRLASVFSGEVQEDFEAAIRLLLDKIPNERSATYDDYESLTYTQWTPHVLALSKTYDDSRRLPDAQRLKPNMDLELKGVHHQTTSAFVESEVEIKESLQIRRELLPKDDRLTVVSYNVAGWACGSLGKYEEGLSLLLEAGRIIEATAGAISTFRTPSWELNTAHVYYCMGRYVEAVKLVTRALQWAKSRSSWHFRLHAILSMVSLRVRTGRLDDVRRYVEEGNEILKTSGESALFSWRDAYCAYRTGQVAMLQGQADLATTETKRAIYLAEKTKSPKGVSSRCYHAKAKMLAKDPDPNQQEESRKARAMARRLRSELPAGGSYLDDESDEALEMIVDMDYR
ncbi:hypothetical protein MBLNU230_g1230t1 [Neophaeotheca triangularis]